MIKARIKAELRREATRKIFGHNRFTDQAFEAYMDYFEEDEDRDWLNIERHRIFLLLVAEAL